VENLLEGAVETLRQLSIIVEDYHEHQPPTFLFDKMCVTCRALWPLCFSSCCLYLNGVVVVVCRRRHHSNGFVEELTQLDRARHEHANVDLPMQIFQFTSFLSLSSPSTFAFSPRPLWCPDSSTKARIRICTYKSRSWSGVWNEMSEREASCTCCRSAPLSSLLRSRGLLRGLA
jgi:hypothetical protein